eukprot:1392033-Amorphochlora_amoeboformis.AAC.3
MIWVSTLASSGLSANMLILLGLRKLNALPLCIVPRSASTSQPRLPATFMDLQDVLDAIDVGRIDERIPTPIPLPIKSRPEPLIIDTIDPTLSQHISSLF